MKMVKRARDVLGIEIEELRRVRARIGRDFSIAARLMLEALGCNGKIVVAGVGKNFHVGQKISATLSSTGSPSVSIHPSQAMHGDIGVLGGNDVLLALSHSGESSEILEILPAAKRIGAAIVGMTGSLNNALARSSDAVIPIPVRREACPFNMAPTASTTAMLAVGDALAIVLLEARGFRKEDFAKLHPGGAIGRTLLLRVCDIMRKDARLARIGTRAKVKDAILAMTSARSGAVGIVERGGKLAGIFTDGDLRRLITRRRGAVADLPIREVMTRRPKIIRSKDLAVEALKIYEKHAIDDLPVIDERRRLVGMVDIQDLPKFKIM